jgi:hypothetical protein
MVIEYKYFCLLPFLVNAFLTTKAMANANLMLAYLNALQWVLERRPHGWDYEKKIVTQVRTFAYMYTIDAFIDSSCLSLEQKQYIHSVSRLGILISFGFTLTSKALVVYVMGMAYMLVILYLFTTHPCEIYYTSLGVATAVMSSVLYMFRNPAHHVGFATFLYCMSKSLKLMV